MSEDQVMRARLLIDGDGNGDDRRLSRLHKMAFELISGTEKKSPSSKTKLAKFTLLAKQCSLDEKRSHCVCAAIEKDRERDELKMADIQKEVESTRGSIVCAKARLHVSRASRRNRMQYDAIARHLQRLKDRKSLQKEIDAVNSDLEELRRKEKNLDNMLDMRKKQCHVLIHSIQQLQKIVNSEEQNNMDTLGESHNMDTMEENNASGEEDHDDKEKKKKKNH